MSGPAAQGGDAERSRDSSPAGLPEFRPTGGEDVERVVEMMRELYAEDGSTPFDDASARAALLRLIAGDGLGRAWCIHADDDVVGYAILTFGYSLEYHGRDAFVDELYVRRSHRGRGFGSEALALMERTCRSAGVRALHLEVERGNAAALAVYRRAGFLDHDRYLLTKTVEAPAD